MDTFKVIAFTHKTIPLDLLGKMHLDKDGQEEKLASIREKFNFNEFLFISTCNRVELLIVSDGSFDQSLILQIAISINPFLTTEEYQQLAMSAEYFSGDNAVRHVLRVAASLDSLVVGEREIITQVRKAYEFCYDLGLTGDFLRLLIKQTIETAKEVYTHTNIARNAVSVASLAYRQLRDLGIKNDARIIFVGSGETNTVLANYFQKHRFANFTVFNRTIENAQKLAGLLNGEAFQLEQLKSYKEGFDVLVVCTASTEPVITEEIFDSLLQGDQNKKTIIDLGIPANVADTISGTRHVNYIDIDSLRAIANQNLQLRKNEIRRCEEIIENRTSLFGDLFRQRKVELAFSEVPKQVKMIKEAAINEVFARDIQNLDEQGRLVLDRVLAYVEKKYNAVAIKTAKEAFLDKPARKSKPDECCSVNE